MNKKKNNLRPLKAKLDIYPLSTYEKREFYQIKTQKGNFIKISAEEKIYLTNRQQEIIEFLNKNEKITTGVISNMFKITRQAALKEISKLVKLDIVKLKGKGRGAYYILL